MTQYRSSQLDAGLDELKERMADGGIPGRMRGVTNGTIHGVISETK